MFTLPAAALAAGLYVIPSTGLGHNGGAANGPNVWGTPADLLDAHVWLYTGDRPGPSGTFTLVTEPLVRRGRRPMCVAMAQWTMPEYSWGYPIPEWPLVMFDQAFYDLGVPASATDPGLPGTVTIRWRVMDGLNGLKPNSNYSVSVLCGPRP